MNDDQDEWMIRPRGRNRWKLQGLWRGLFLFLFLFHFFLHLSFFLHNPQYSSPNYIHHYRLNPTYATLSYMAYAYARMLCLCNVGSLASFHITRSVRLWYGMVWYVDLLISQPCMDRRPQASLAIIFQYLVYLALPVLSCLAQPNQCTYICN